MNRTTCYTFFCKQSSLKTNDFRTETKLKNKRDTEISLPNPALAVYGLGKEVSRACYSSYRNRCECQATLSAKVTGM